MRAKINSIKIWDFPLIRLNGKLVKAKALTGSVSSRRGNREQIIATIQKGDGGFDVINFTREIDEYNSHHGWGCSHNTK